MSQYQQQLKHLKDIFPGLTEEVMLNYLTQNKGVLDETIDQLLAVTSIDEMEIEPETKVKSTKNSVTTIAVEVKSDSSLNQSKPTSKKAKRLKDDTRASKKKRSDDPPKKDTNSHDKVAKPVPKELPKKETTSADNETVDKIRSEELPKIDAVTNDLKVTKPNNQEVVSGLQSMVIPFPSGVVDQIKLISEYSKQKNFIIKSVEREDCNLILELCSGDHSEYFTVMIPENLRTGNYMLLKQEDIEDLGRLGSLVEAANHVIKIFAKSKRVSNYPQFIDSEKNQGSIDDPIREPSDSEMDPSDSFSDTDIEWVDHKGGPVLVHDPEKNPNDLDPENSFLPPQHEFEALSVMNSLQTDALKFIVDKSKQQSQLEYPKVLERVMALGFKEDGLKATLRYIRDEAPIIVHFPLEQIISLLVNDSHYRNQFETGTSRGSLNRTARTGWEDSVFNKIYTNSGAFDRPKYGVLNIVKDPNGVQCCYSYGDSYLILKKVRLRTTFASCDTSSSNVKVASCEYYAHVLNSYSDQELKAVIEVATGKQPHCSSSCISCYKEVQIHGPVSLNENVEAIVPNKRFRTDKERVAQIERFAQNNNCKIIWME